VKFPPDNNVKIINGYFIQLNDKEDDFIIKNESGKESRGRSTGENGPHRNNAAGNSSNVPVFKKRKHSYKKYNHTKTFMDMTMAQMVKNREVDPLVNKGLPQNK
jgi:hypothetical protein